MGIFGTVGSGKSNTSQVLIEEAAANGWAVIVLDVESEYIEMDSPSQEPPYARSWPPSAKARRACAISRSIIPQAARAIAGQLSRSRCGWQTSRAASLAKSCRRPSPSGTPLLDCIEHLESRAQTKMATSEADGLGSLLGRLAAGQSAVHVAFLEGPCRGTLARSERVFRLHRAVGQADVAGAVGRIRSARRCGPSTRNECFEPGRVSVFDVSVANDIVKNLVTADLLRKLFAYKVARGRAADAAGDRGSALVHQPGKSADDARHHANAAERDPAWPQALAVVAFVSQQPGHLPPEIFELCNTRIVHTLRSMHNLEVLMATAGDVGQEMWARCPLLGPGEAIVTSPQLKRRRRRGGSASEQSAKIGALRIPGIPVAAEVDPIAATLLHKTTNTFRCRRCLFDKEYLPGLAGPCRGAQSEKVVRPGRPNLKTSCDQLALECPRPGEGAGRPSCVKRARNGILCTVAGHRERRRVPAAVTTAYRRVVLSDRCMASVASGSVSHVPPKVLFAV